MKEMKMKYLFQNKLKDRTKIKGISFSYEEKDYPKNFKNRKQDISFKQKITDKAILNSFKNYTLLKSLIYAKEQKEKNIVKIDKMEKENIKDLKTDLNYTNLLKIFNLVFNKYNPFNYNIKKRKLEIEKTDRNIYKNKVKQALLKKILNEKKVTSRIDSGIKKDSNFNNIYNKIEKSKIKFEKFKLLNDRKLCLNFNTTRECNISNINLIKNLNKSNSFIGNKSNFIKYNKYNVNLNNSEIKSEILNKNESINLEHSLNNTLKENDNINNDINKVGIKKLNKCKSEIRINNYTLTKKNNNHNNIFKKNKNLSDKYIFSNNNYKNKNFTNKSINLKFPKDNNDFSDIQQKKYLEEKLRKYAANIEYLFKEYKKIKSNSNKLKIEYKMWHFSKYSNIEEIINTKEDMLLCLLKQKYFKNKNVYAKSKKIKKKSVIDIIKADFNKIEDEEFRFRKRVY